MIQIPIMDHNLFNILPEVSEIFTLEPAVIHTDATPILIVADLHGDMKALWSALRKKTDLGCDTVIFLGDYIDRGSESLDVLEKVYSLKIAEPDKIILLRGNHELKETNRFEKLFEDLEYDEDLFTSINNVFDKMPIGAVISDKIFCVHGGIPGAMKLSEITKEGVYPFVWNDPSEIDGIGESSRGLGMRTFGEDVFDEFLQVNGLERMVRGHSMVEGGFRWWFGGRLLSLYSAVGYDGNVGLGAVAVVKNDFVKIITH